VRKVKTTNGWVWKELAELRKAEANLRHSYKTLSSAGDDGVAAFLSSLAELDRRSLHLERWLDGGAL
jgi:hypothetical protein